MRIQVNVNDNLVKKIDELAKEMGVSRSALCSVYIQRQYLDEMKKRKEILK